MLSISAKCVREIKRKVINMTMEEIANVATLSILTLILSMCDQKSSVLIPAALGWPTKHNTVLPSAC